MDQASAIPSWMWAGFSEPPLETEAKGGEILYRAYGGTSAILSNCFFVPAIGNTPIGYWTAELLEMELNAALWGNEFEGINRFQLVEGTRYCIGPIAHDNYSGYEKLKLPERSAEFIRFDQRSFVTPSGIFKQVTIILSGDEKLSDRVVRIGSSIPIREGRYARMASARAKTRPQ